MCTEGKKLSSHQATLLRHFDIKMARSTLSLSAALLGKENPEFKEFETAGEDGSSGESDGEMAFDDGLPASMMLPA